MPTQRNFQEKGNKRSITSIKLKKCSAGKKSILGRTSGASIAGERKKGQGKWQMVLAKNGHSIEYEISMKWKDSTQPMYKCTNMFIGFLLYHYIHLKHTNFRFGWERTRAVVREGPISHTRWSIRCVGDLWVEHISVMRNRRRVGVGCINDERYLRSGVKIHRACS